MSGKRWILLGLLGAVVLLVLARTQRDNLMDAPSQSLQDDYYMRDFVLTVFDGSGRREYVARGPDLRRATSGDYTLQSPEIEWLDHAGPPWILRAASGRLDAAMQNARLDGDVRLDRSSSPPAHFETEHLESHLPSREAHTDGPVLVRQGGNEIRGTGLSADLQAERLTLNAQVRGTYAP